jgi:hypothetical protein
VKILPALVFLRGLRTFLLILFSSSGPGIPGDLIHIVSMPPCKTFILNSKREETNLLWGKFLSLLGECPITEHYIPTLYAGIS